MVVKDIQLARSRKTIVLSAQCKIRKIGWDEVYFKYDDVSKNPQDVFKDASPFAAALLIPSMRLGEDLIIKGSISNELHAGMQAIMAEVLQWDIGLKPIRIKSDKLSKDDHRPKKNATFFSGGVDSFYTYLKHKNNPAKNERIDSLVLVNGFDISLRDTDVWRLALRNIRALAKVEKVELVTVHTNVRKVLEPLLCNKGAWENPWDYIHGGCLAAAGLGLRGQYKNIYIPSTYAAVDQRPRGIGPEIDKHWSTERQTFIHDGTEATRLDKVCWQVAKSPVALHYLRVCFMNKKGAYNCGRCDKCLRTMVNLYIAGVLDQAVTFPKSLDLKLIATVPPDKSEDGDIFHRENLQALQAVHKSPELQEALISSLRLYKASPIQTSLITALKTKVRQHLRQALRTDYTYAGGHVRSAILNTPLGQKIF